MLTSTHYCDGRRILEAELCDTNEGLSDLTCTNQALVGAKAKCEQELNSLGHDLDEMASEAGMSEDKAQRAMVDTARLADELRGEQDIAMLLEGIRNSCISREVIQELACQPK